MEKLSRDQILTLPNAITIVRILAIPVILLLLNPGRDYQVFTAIFFMAAAVTDYVDGYMARRRGLVTTLGKFLDPLADKLLIVTGLIALIPTRGIPVWMVVVIVGREIAVTGLRGIAVSQGMVIAASTLGRYKTFFEVLAIFCLIMKGGSPHVNFYNIGMILLWVATGLAILSAADYFRKFLKEIVV